MQLKERKKILLKCPKCKKPGFLTLRWVRSSFYPMYASLKCMLVEETENQLVKNPNNEYYQTRLRRLREKVRGYRYLGPESENSIDKQSVYRVSSRLYWHYYIGHYDSKKYQEQMVNYRSGKRKSRPNGRRWCKLPGSRIIQDLNGRYMRF